MIRALILLLIVLIGFIAGPLLAGHTGYVLIAIAGYTIETSVVVLVLGIVTLFLLIQTLEWLVRRISQGSRRGLRWAERRRLRKGKTLFYNALYHLLSDNPEAAEQAATQSTDYLPDPRAGWLLAAIAADQRLDTSAKGRYLHKATGTEPAITSEYATLTTDLYQAEQAAPEQATGKLDALVHRYPQHPGVLRSAARLHYQHRAWDSLASLLSVIEKEELVPTARLQAYREAVYTYFFSRAGSAEALHQQWKALDRKTRQLPVARLCYCAALLKKGEVSTAEKIAIRGLSKGYLRPAHLLHISAHLNWQGANELLDYISDYITAAPDDSVALALLGQLALQNRDYELAVRALRTATRLDPSKENHRLLGDAYLAAGESQDALGAYRLATQQDV